MLSAERKCCKRTNQCQFWSPTQREIARSYSYWKQKAIMEAKKLIGWDQLNKLCVHTQISDYDHSILDPKIIQSEE
jgi:hypothetical protein